ncbi:MAG: hypothetical protein J2P23_03815 [Microlunatus sp.]|nr:hypothetical protein [Microlunatus sp.]
MTILGVLLIAVAVADLCRRRTLPVWAPLAAGPLMIIALGLLAGLGSVGGICLLIGSGLITVGWVVLAGRSRIQAAAEGVPLGVLIGGVLVVIILSPLAGSAGGVLAAWLRASGWPALAAVGPDRFLLLAGLFLIQLSTGNEIVRLVLAATGTIKPFGQPQAADQLRGGRMLGPLERVFLFGLGFTGHATAAGLVIAAKGLIRFPELNARRSGGSVSGVGIDEVTEYFLLGSFLSWLISLIGIGIAAIG